MKLRFLLVMGAAAALCGTAQAVRVFYDDFQTFGAVWHTYPPNPENECPTCGPVKMETWPREWNHTPDCVNPPDCDPRGEIGPQCICTSARHYEHSHVWPSWQHEVTVPEDKAIKYSVWFLDLFYRTDRTEVVFVHYQVQGWITILDILEEDHACMGIHAHWTNPAENWLHYSWKTASDGWHVTSVPRSYGWHLFTIIVHPYTGGDSDVEFFIDGLKVGQGRRMLVGGTAWPPGSVRIGADPEQMDEDYVANTYQNTYYDDVSVAVRDNGDFDFDEDVDLVDFGVFQACFNGPNRAPKHTECGLADFDDDGDVDLVDFGAFQACFNGPNRPAAASCVP